jgi:hypothetical protein
MTSNAFIDFSSRDCKLNLHQKCHGKWHGFGFEVFCSCSCHNNGKNALDQVGSQTSNALDSLSSYGEIQR